MRQTFLVLFFVLLLMKPFQTQAATAYPGQMPYTEEATGQTVAIINHGDENFHYMTDLDSQVLLVDDEGYLRYVVESNGIYELGGYVTGQRTEESIVSGDVVRVGKTISRELLCDLRNQIDASKPQTFSEDTKPIQTIPLDYNFAGDAAEDYVHVCSDAEDEQVSDVSNYPDMLDGCPLLVLKVQFEDVKCSFDDAAWNKRIFEDGVANYYNVVSNGQFSYYPAAEKSNTENDGVVTVTLPFDEPLYTIAGEGNQNASDDLRMGIYQGTDGKNYAVYNSASLFAYALIQADGEIDFASYDRNDDGYVSPTELAILVVCAGYEAAYTGPEIADGKPAVWAHSWIYNNILKEASEAHYMTIAVDDKQVFKYTMLGECSNLPDEYDVINGTGNARQTQYGTATHELGHDMGLVDLYCTTGEGVTQEVGYLSLMAVGNWGFIPGGDPGSMPAHLDPYSKIWLGYYTPIEGAMDQNYILYATEPASQYNILRVNTDDPKIYYLIENRETVGYDQGLCGGKVSADIGGLVVWQIDENSVEKYWDSNQINSHNGEFGIMPVEAQDTEGVKTSYWTSAIPLECWSKLQGLLQLSSGSKQGNAMEAILTSLKLVQHPADVEVTAGDKAVFSVEATGYGLTYQWYQRQGNEGEGAVIEGAVEASYILDPADSNRNGYQYYCVVTDAYGGSLTSNGAVLSVKEKVVPPQIDPQDKPVSKEPISAQSKGKGISQRPATGDASEPMVWIGILVVCGSAIFSMLLSRYIAKRKYKEES